MGDTPGSLTELKVQIGKDVHAISLSLMHNLTDEYISAVVNTPDTFFIEAAETLRTNHSDIAETFGQAAAKALAELPNSQTHALAGMLTAMLGYTSDMVDSDSRERVIYALALAEGTLEVAPQNAREYLEALVAHGRGE